MRSACVLAALLAAAPASAQAPRQVQIEIPDECAIYTEREEDWSNLISVATCMQRVRVPCIDDPAEVEAIVEGLAGEIAPSILIYVATMENGPNDAKLRAAYHIGLTSLALVTRARSSIAVPDLTDLVAMKRFRVLHARVEYALAPALATARVSFGLVVTMAAHERALRSDPVQREMIRSAVTMLLLLDDHERPTYLVKRGT